MATESTVRLQDQPKGLKYLFFAELWERFSFYGLRALLVLYMSTELKFSDSKSYGVYAAYFTMVYLTTILGGVIADRLLGNRKSIVTGGVLITLGHISLAFSGISTAFFFVGLGFVIGGTGLFKANISTMVGQLYEPGDKRRDSGFTLFYIGINIGGLLAPLLCGFVGEVYGWHYGFGLAAIGMMAGLVTFVRGDAAFEDKGLPPRPAALSEKKFGMSKEVLVYGAAFCAIPVFTLLLMQYHIFEAALPVIGVCFLGYSGYLVFAHKGAERRDLITIFGLMFFQIAFFSIFEQAGSSVNLFTERNVDRDLFGYVIPTSLFQSLNSLFIILMGSVFAGLWTWLGRKNRDPSPAVKFALALMQAGLGFGALCIGVATAGDNGLTSMVWVVLAYFFHTTGELCIMPVGLSMVTRLSPSKILSTVMGLWFVSLAFSEFLAGVFAKISAVEVIDGAVDQAASLLVYGHAFWVGTKFAIAMAVILFLVSPWLPTRK